MMTQSSYWTGRGRGRGRQLSDLSGLLFNPFRWFSPVVRVRCTLTLFTVWREAGLAIEGHLIIQAAAAHGRSVVSIVLFVVGKHQCPHSCFAFFRLSIIGCLAVVLALVLL